jgi:putative ABC transport system permease protein
VNGLRELWHRLRSLARRGDLERGLDEEIRFHIDQQTEKNLRAGLSPEEARRQALVRFGGVENFKEDARDEFRIALVQDSFQDLRQAGRALRRSPAFTTVAVLTLALGIGATTAVFTVVKGVLIEPLPYPDGDALMSLKHTSVDDNGGPPYGLSGAILATYARENRSFQHIGIWSRGTASLKSDTVAEEVSSVNVSEGTLKALDVPPVLGRWFAEEDHTPGKADAVILTHGYWHRRFASDKTVIGRTVTIDSKPRTVIAVMPATFRFLDETPEVFLPLRFEPGTLTLGGFSYEGLARLSPGITPDQAKADLLRIVPIWLDAWPTYPGIDRAVFVKAGLLPHVRPLKEEIVGGVSDVLWVVMGTIGTVLLIACANVANLTLVRAASREHELATRTALGASRLRVARGMLAESLVIGLAGGALGVALSWAGLKALSALGPRSLPRLHEVQLDAAALIFTASISVLSALFFGCIPVFKYTGRRTASALRASNRNVSDGRERQGARNTLVVVQVSLALILLVGSGLMIRTFVALRNVDPGFVDPHHVQLVRVTIPEALVPDTQLAFRLQRDMRDRLAAIPGIAFASFTGNVPMAVGERSRSSIQREDDPPEKQLKSGALRWFRFVTPGYFRTIGTRVVAGRDFAWNDLDTNTPVAVISENLAREFWREPASALGKRIREGDTSPWREVIGVVGDVYDDGVHQSAPPIVYWPLMMQTYQGQTPFLRRSVTFAMRTNLAGTETLLAEVRKAVHGVNAEVPLTRVRTLGEVYDRTMAGTSFTLVMLAIAALVALALGSVGIYGVIEYAVSQRRREIGIRVALGASGRDVTRMFVGQGLALGAAGVCCGAVGAAVLSRLLSSLLFGTSPLDPMTFAVVSVGLVGITAVASYIPAHRASRVDPVETLRGE